MGSVVESLSRVTGQVTGSKSVLGLFLYTTGNVSITVPNTGEPLICDWINHLKPQKKTDVMGFTML